jgi:glycosyltransferase involved in cell wall biosynthesis
MKNRKQINLLYVNDPNWAGGSIYILNIIRALNFMSDEEKPYLVIYHPAESNLEELRGIGYTHIKLIEFKNSKIIRAFYRMLRLLGFDLRVRVTKGKLDNLYPVSTRYSISNITDPIYWIPDFQELYYPDFFGKTGLSTRKASHRYIIKSKKKIVFSSYNAQQDFEKFYPQHQNEKYVLSFVSIMDFNFLANIPPKKLLAKYSIERPYFIVSNQFWIHKNHGVVLNAIKIARKVNPDLLVVFTGKEYDFRYPKYAEQLKKIVEEEDLKVNVKFLGFIDRDDQLALMKYSRAVIQPSLFEGWSTVVEDSKTLDKHVILSDIPIHKEQLDSNVTFFNPHDAVELSNIMLSHEKRTVPESPIDELRIKLNQRATSFGKEIMAIMS